MILLSWKIWSSKNTLWLTFATTKRRERMYKILYVMSKLSNLFLFIINFYWRETISIWISKCKYENLRQQSNLIFFSISWMSNKLFDKKWFSNELTFKLIISKMRINNLIDKSINKIASKRTIFFNNLTFVIFNFRINIDRHLIIIYINIKILFIKIIKNFNIRSQTCQKIRSSFLFCQLSNNFCNWFSKTRQILHEKNRIKCWKQAKKNSIIVTKSKYLLSTNLKKKKIAKSFYNKNTKNQNQNHVTNNNLNYYELNNNDEIVVVMTNSSTNFLRLFFD